MKSAFLLAAGLLAMTLSTQATPDEAPIRRIVQDEVTAWNKGDAEAFSRHMAPDATFTNVLGMYSTGREAFRERHEEIFKGIFSGTTLQQDVVSIKFIRTDVAVVETLTWVSGFSKAGLPPGMLADSKGRLRSRLLQVMQKDGNEWKTVAYHNVDVKPGIPSPEPQSK